MGTKIKEIIEEIKKHFFPHLEGELENAIVCEEILSENICKALEEAAKKLKVDIAKINELINEALDKGLRKANEIIKYIRGKLIDLSKVTCADVLSESICNKIKEIASTFHIKFDTVMKVIKEALSKGLTKAKEIIEYIKKHFFPRFEGELENDITCEDILSEKICNALKRAAKRLKVDIAKVDELVNEAIEQGKKSAAEIAAYVRGKLIDLSTLTCADVLSQAICDKIKEVAGVIHVKYDEVVKVIKQAVSKGLTKIKDIIAYLKKHFFPRLEGELEADITCEDILSEKICHDLREAAKKLKIKVEAIDKLVREALEKGYRKASDIIKHIRAKIIDMAKNFKCTDALPESICAKIEEVAAKLKIKMDEVMKVMKDIISRGITKINEIIEEIKKHFFPHLEGELNLVKCEDYLSPQVCSKMREIAAKLKIKVEEVDRTIRELVAKKITEAKELIKHLREKLIELATNFKCTDVLSKDVCDEVHAFAKQIKVAVEKVDEVIKKIVVAGVTKAEEIIKKIIEHFFPHH